MTGPARSRPLRRLPAARRTGFVGMLAAAAMTTGCASDGSGPADGAAGPPTTSTSTSAVPGAGETAPTTTTTPSPTEASGDARRLGLRAVAALKRDDPARAIALIRAGADVNARDAIKDSVFLYAGAEGYTEVVRVALVHGADTRVLNRYGGTALIPASEHAHLPVIRLLLRSSDVEVDHVNDLGWTALGEAVGLGDGGPRSQEAVRLLLAAGADPRARDRFGRTVLENAERLGYAEIARILRAAGA